MLPQKNRAAVFNGPKNFQIKDLPLSDDSKVLLRLYHVLFADMTLEYLTRGIEK